MDKSVGKFKCLMSTEENEEDRELLGILILNEIEDELLRVWLHKKVIRAGKRITFLMFPCKGPIDTLQLCIDELVEEGDLEEIPPFQFNIFGALNIND